MPATLPILIALRRDVTTYFQRVSGQSRRGLAERSRTKTVGDTNAANKVDNYGFSALATFRQRSLCASTVTLLLIAEVDVTKNTSADVLRTQTSRPTARFLCSIETVTFYGLSLFFSRKICAELTAAPVEKTDYS
ncbi:hypothetical protein Trydic_g242 [Trypoxylus dichotomus]